MLEGPDRLLPTGETMLEESGRLLTNMSNRAGGGGGRQ